MAELKSYHITFTDPGLKPSENDKLADTFNFQKLVRYSRESFELVKSTLKDAGFGADDVGSSHVHPNERRMKIELSEKAFEFITQKSKTELVFIEKIDAMPATDGPSCDLKNKGGCPHCSIH